MKTAIDSNLYINDRETKELMSKLENLKINYN